LKIQRANGAVNQRGGEKTNQIQSGFFADVIHRSLGLIS
jgi:hypothetical protein